MTRDVVRLYATPSGKRYHRDLMCDGLNAWYCQADRSWHGDQAPPTVTMAQARDRGLTPCSMCQPPPMLTVISTSTNDQAGA